LVGVVTAIVSKAIMINSPTIQLANTIGHFFESRAFNNALFNRRACGVLGISVFRTGYSI
jgi:hypothetical protein